MGCDIHLFVEKKNKETGKWEIVKGPNPKIEDYREWAKFAESEGDLEHAEKLRKRADEIESGKAFEKAIQEEKEWREKYPEDYENYVITIEEYCDYMAPECYEGWAYDGRNYDLFGMLANVRNGWGFAGCDTGDGFKPIAMPKGVPDDASDYYLRKVEEWGCDGHSHSWLTIRELLEYDWHGQRTKKRGWVGEEEFKVYLEKGRPESWSGGVFGGDVIHVTPAQMRAIIEGHVAKEEGKEYYTQVEWEVSYYESAKKFCG